MADHVEGKVIIVTGGAKGFGRLICGKALARGAKVVCADLDEAALADMAAAHGDGLRAVRADVTVLGDLQAAVREAVAAFGGVDVMVNNAGVMPLAFYADHAQAGAAWSRCIDINIKGVLHGIMAAHDQMIAQGRGQIVNISSIYGNFPVAGAGVYGATKAAVNFLSDALRAESQGKIKVTTIRPTGVPGTGLGGGVVNPAAIVGILGQNAPGYLAALGALADPAGPQEPRDPHGIGYLALEPDYIADAVIHAIDQPWGVSISDITVRASGDQYIL